TGLAALVEMLKVGWRLRGISGREIANIVAWFTGSLADLLHRHFESDQAKALLMANTVYGKHGGPYQPGSALGLLFHLLNSGAHDTQGFSGHVIGGMGAITRALAAAARQAGADVRTSSAVGRIDVRDGRVRGVLLENGTEIRSRVVLSNADPKRTCLDLLEPAASPADFRHAIAAIRMNGPCAKVNLVLDAEPHVSGIWGTYERAVHRAVFTLVPSLEAVERCYDAAKLGAIPDELWIDCVVASNVDETLAPRGRHVMTCFVQYVPYRLRDGTWDEKRDLLGDRVVRKIGEYAPNVPGAIVARQVLTPLDLEREYGLTEGNIFHGDLSLDQLFFMRPVPGWSRYRLPIAGLYLCGAGAHPGGGVTGIPGYNAARQVIADLKRRRA
ncbi:MAG: phytoene desaturase family protein, partial [Vicinamibacteraceae bacterium]